MSALFGKRFVLTFPFRNILISSSFKQKPTNSVRFFRHETVTFKLKKWKLGIGILGGGMFCLSIPFLDDNQMSRFKSPPPEESKKIENKMDKGPYNSLISRKVDGPNKLSLKLTLFQYQTCPFCCKVRAYLDYYGIPYDVVEVNPVFRSELHFSEYKKVPIIILEEKPKNYKQLNDSSAIISMLETYILDPQQNFEEIIEKYPLIISDKDSKQEKKEIMNRYHVMFGEHELINRTFDDIREEIKWRKWTDEVLVHSISPNIYRTLKESYESFCYFSEIGNWKKYFSYFERQIIIIVGSAAMYLVGKRLKSKHHLKDDVRQSLYDNCDTWLKAVGKNKFKGGDSPDLADLAVYGVLSSMEGCQAFRDLLQNTRIRDWYLDTQEAVRRHAGNPQ